MPQCAWELCSKPRAKIWRNFSTRWNFSYFFLFRLLPLFIRSKGWFRSISRKRIIPSHRIDRVAKDAFVCESSRAPLEELNKRLRLKNKRTAAFYMRLDSLDLRQASSCSNSPLFICWPHFHHRREKMTGLGTARNNILSCKVKQNWCARQKKSINFPPKLTLKPANSGKTIVRGAKRSSVPSSMFVHHLIWLSIHPLTRCVAFNYECAHMYRELWAAAGEIIWIFGGEVEKETTGRRHVEWNFIINIW